MRPMSPSRRASGVILAALAASCGGGTTDSTPPPGETPTIGVSVSPGAVVLQTGNSIPVTVTVSRGGGFAGTISLSLTNAPTGVTGTFAPQSVPAASTTATLTLVAAPTAAAGSYSLTVRASGTGVTDQTASLGLTVSAAPSGTYAMTVSPTLVALTQGQSGQATVSIDRTGGYNGPVALSITGAPIGLTTSLTPPSAAGTSSAVGLTAASNLAAGDYPLTIVGTVAGLPDRSAGLTVRVSAPPPPGGNVTFTFCAAQGANPIWLAVQDGAGAWSRVTGVNDVYTFSVASGKGGVSWVTSANSNNFSQATLLATTAELQAYGAAQCPGGKTVTGSVAGVAAPNLAYVTLGGAGAVVTPALTTAFSLPGVADGPRDLVAARTQTIFQGPTPLTGISRMIVRRGLNPPAGGSLALLDFAGSEGFDPDQRTLTILNAGTDISRLTLGYLTATSAQAPYLVDGSPGAQATRPWWGIPSNRQAPGDMHAVTVSATPGAGLPFVEQRTTQLFTAEARDRTIVMGSTPSPVTLSVAASGPVRFRIQFQLQAEYSRFFSTTFAQSLGGAVRNSFLSVSGGWLPSSAAGTAVDVTMPDFNGTPGWSGSWGLLAGFQVTWTHTVLGWSASGGGVAPPVVEGGLVQTGTRTGLTTP